VVIFWYSLLKTVSLINGPNCWNEVSIIRENHRLRAFIICNGIDWIIYQLWAKNCGYFSDLFILLSPPYLKRIMWSGKGDGDSCNAYFSHYNCFPHPLDTYNTLTHHGHGPWFTIGNQRIPYFRLALGVS